MFLHRTRTGKVIYRRKTNTFRMSDVLRIVQRLRDFNEKDAELAGVVILVLTVGLEFYNGHYKAGLSLWDIPNPAWTQLGKFLGSRDGAAYNQRDPLLGSELYMIWETLKAWQIIHVVQEVKDAIPNE